MTPAWAIDHTPWDKLLQTYVTPHEDGVNRFDYAAVTTADRAALDQYIAYLAAQTPSQKTDVETHSFYINLYNALTVQVILDNWPVSSIREIRNGFFSIGPWAKPRVMVEGEELSLDNIEHDILRPAMNDPRVHYAVNCASWGCPNLASRAYTPEWLDEMLDEAARTFINHKRGVRVDKYGRVHTSSIFKWYIEDFGNSDKGVIAHAQQYAAPELAKALAGKTKIDKHSYDWTINAVGKNEGDW
ncbi:MAG: DUF547 domain-containing protein [Alphaproteobacteria bacterium]